MDTVNWWGLAFAVVAVGGGVFGVLWLAAQLFPCRCPLCKPPSSSEDSDV